MKTFLGVGNGHQKANKNKARKLIADFFGVTDIESRATSVGQPGFFIMSVDEADGVLAGTLSMNDVMRNDDALDGIYLVREVKHKRGTRLHVFFYNKDDVVKLYNSALSCSDNPPTTCSWFNVLRHSTDKAMFDVIDGKPELILNFKQEI